VRARGFRILRLADEKLSHGRIRVRGIKPLLILRMSYLNPLKTFVDGAMITDCSTLFVQVVFILESAFC
jgi:hypothetical protein